MMQIILLSRMIKCFHQCVPCLKKKAYQLPATATTPPINLHIYKKRSSRRTRKVSRRVSRVISEIHDFKFLSKKELIAGIKIEAKALALFFALFVIYVLFGAFLFFYIEECSGASMADDNSTPSLTDTLEEVTFKNITETCILLYEESQATTVPNNMTSVNTIIYNSFLDRCEIILKSSTKPFVSKQGYKTKCVVDEFQMLKYAEYTIFTLLTIGYGNTTPVTIVGRYLLIAYALFGVPIAVSMYSVAGKLLVQCFTLLIKYFESDILKIKNTNEKLLQTKVLIFSFLAMAGILSIGCSVTMREDMENWKFSSSIYFWFVSMTTIGYGDLHFDRNKHLASIHFLLISASTLLFGLGMTAAIIEAVSMALEQHGLTNNNDEHSTTNGFHGSTADSVIHTDVKIKSSSKNGYISEDTVTDDLEKINMRNCSNKKVNFVNPCFIGDNTSSSTIGGNPSALFPSVYYTRSNYDFE